MDRLPQLVVTSPAKVNLTVTVGPVRADGYHALDSVFHLLDFGDVLHFFPADELQVETSIDLGIPAEENLVTRALISMAELYGRERPHLRVFVEKHIPAGAGLGGGSSNAAAAIVGLATLWGHDPADPRHLELAARLGSDVPVFLAPTAASLMSGRGEVLVRSLEPAAGVPIVLAKTPKSVVSTAAVYRAFDELPVGGAGRNGSSDPSATHPSLEHIAPALYNNLTSAACAVAPDIAPLLDALTQNPLTETALLAGSGGACFAVCADKQAATTLAAELQDKGYWAQATQLAGSGITVTNPEKTGTF